MKTSLLSLTALLLFSFANAQTADEIVSKHVDAIGGADILSQVKSIYTESSTEVMGNQSESKTTILSGKGFRDEVSFNGQQIVRVATDKGGWNINPFAGGDAPEPMSADEYKSTEDAIYIDPLYDYAAHGAKVELMGQEQVDSVNAYKLKYTNKDSGEVTYYIDPATWFIIESVRKGSMQGQEVAITTSYSNFKKMDFGIYVPYIHKVDMGQFALSIANTSVDINKDVDPAIFEMPK